MTTQWTAIINFNGGWRQDCLLFCIAVYKLFPFAIWLLKKKRKITLQLLMSQPTVSCRKHWNGCILVKVTPSARVKKLLCRHFVHGPQALFEWTESAGRLRDRVCDIFQHQRQHFNTDCSPPKNTHAHWLLGDFSHLLSFSIQYSYM